MTLDHRVIAKTVFEIPKMDCSAEERMVRMALEGQANVRGLDVDLPARRLTIPHSDEPSAILHRLAPLGLGTHLVSSTPAAPTEQAPASSEGESRTLRMLLAINAAMFVFELTARFAGRGLPRYVRRRGRVWHSCAPLIFPAGCS